MRIAHPHLLDATDGWPTLAARLAAGPMRPAELASLLAPIADALDAAHRLGVVHGAVGAETIVVAPSGDAFLTGLGDRGGDPAVDVRALAALSAQPLVRPGTAAALAAALRELAGRAPARLPAPVAPAARRPPVRRR